MARVARQKGGVAYLQRVSIRGVSPRSSQLTRTRPPPSAALRYAATSPLRGGGLLLPWRGVLGSRGSASHKRRGSRRRPKTRQPEAPQTRSSNSSPLGEDGARSATEGGRCVSAVRFDSRRLTKKLPANSHPPPSVGCAALRRHLPPSGWRITIALAGRVGSAEWRQPEPPWSTHAP